MSGQVGPRGLAVLVLAGIAGLFLAIVGWSQRGTGVVAPRVGGLGGSVLARTAASPWAAPTASVGPLGSSEPYASSAFLLWPGTLVVTTVQGHIVP